MEVHKIPMNELRKLYAAFSDNTIIRTIEGYIVQKELPSIHEFYWVAPHWAIYIIHFVQQVQLFLDRNNHSFVFLRLPEM